MDTETPASIVTDETGNTAEREFNAADAFLKDATTERKDEKAPAAAPSDAEEEATETAAEEATAETEDPEFDIKVGEETRKAKLSDLKRLYGQEAALTQKSQVLAEARTKAEAASDAATAILTAQTTRAEALWKPYADLDYLALSAQMDPTDFAALRVEAKAALENLNTLKSTLDGHEKATQERNAVTHRERAQATIAELSDPDKGIKGWGPELYGNIMGYAVAQGIGEQAARGIVDSTTLRLMHKAMLYDQGKAKSAEVRKVVDKATVTLKPGPAPKVEGDGFKSAMKAMLKDRGSLDSTAAAFLVHSRNA